MFQALLAAESNVYVGNDPSCIDEEEGAVRGPFAQKRAGDLDLEVARSALHLQLQLAPATVLPPLVGGRGYSHAKLAILACCWTRQHPEHVVRGTARHQNDVLWMMLPQGESVLVAMAIVNTY